MHSLFVFLYCWAATTHVPISHETLILVHRMVAIFFPNANAEDAAKDHDDPLTTVSLLHVHIEPSTFVLDEVVNRFGEDGDVSAKVWGPSAWNLLHTLAAGPNFTNVPHLLEVWETLLPCQVCRTHLQHHTRLTRFDGTTVEEVIRYTNALHNAVNASLGKAPRLPL